MKTFTVRDLREHTGDFIQGATNGQLSLVTKHGQPVLLAVPFTEEILQTGLRPMLAAELFKNEYFSLSKAAKLSGQSLQDFVQLLNSLKISIANYPPEELEEELEDFE